MPVSKTMIAPLANTDRAGSSPMSTFTASILGNQITITDTDIIGKTSRTRTYQITAQDDETFMIPDDLHSSTQNMLIGIGQRMMYLKRYGFEREP